MRGARPGADLAPRFRCLVCRAFVTGTIDGVCPRCGWRPPDSPRAPHPPRRAIAIPSWMVLVALVALVAGVAWIAR